MKHEANRYPPYGFADRLKKAREDKKIGKGELADRVHISRETVKSYENGDNAPTLTIIAKIAVVLEVSLDWLAYGKDK